MAAAEDQPSSQQQFMSEAIQLSREMMEDNRGGPFGAVVVRAGQVVGRGHNGVTSMNDPTAHAEVMAIRDAARRLETYVLSDCQLYTSCEPCPMCLGAIYWARIKEVFYACTREDAAHFGFDDAMIYEEVCRPLDQRQVPMTKLMQDEARDIFRRWETKEDRIPY